jgi:transcriptional regulator with XRE-family HTH domain
MEPKYRFGEKLREVRERRQLTLREVADRSGLSESLISQIERNKVVPALDTLLAVVEVLEMDLEYLFQDWKRERRVHLVRRSEREKILLKKVAYERLSHTLDADHAHGLEAYYLEIQPGGEKGSHEYGHIGKELGVVIEGQGALTVGAKTYPLREGDSISFGADTPHVLKNTGTTRLRAFWVTTPPKKFTDR